MLFRFHARWIEREDGKRERVYEERATEMERRKTEKERTRGNTERLNGVVWFTNGGGECVPLKGERGVRR